MVALLRRSLNEGGLGLSTSQAGTHRDRDGNPVPSRAAGRDELLALAGVLADVPGMSVSLVPAGSLGQFSDDEVRLLTDLSLASRAAVNWNVLGVSAGNPAQHEHQLAASDHATAHGATVVALTLPHRMQMRLSLRSGFLFDSLPGWAEFIGLPVPERIAALGDPGVRRRLDAGARSDEAGLLRALADWGRFAIVETFDPANAGLEGRTLRDVAAERGGDPFDVLCDVVVADDLRTGLDPRFMVDQPGDAEARAAVWADPRTVIGGSDAGAHLDMMCGAVATTSLLAEGVRDHQVISLEEAVRQLTDVPARLYGLDGRGQVREGWHADLVLFDPDTVAPGPVRTRDDLPGGAARLYAESEGIQSVWVNGSAIVRDGAFTGSTPGTVLRSGGT
jgi:N-acyl-D-aspartate/D-glutamate deacylase